MGHSIEFRLYARDKIHPVKVIGDAYDMHYWTSILESLLAGTYNSISVERYEPRQLDFFEQKDYQEFIDL